MNAATEKNLPTEANPRRGLTYRDLDVGSYGFTDVPEKVRSNRSYARAAPKFPKACPIAAVVSRKSELWAFNTGELLRGSRQPPVERHHRHPVGTP